MKLAVSVSLVVLAVCALVRPNPARWIDNPTPSASGDAAELLRAAQRVLNSLPPLIAQVEMTAHYLGQDIVCQGQYVQAGQGTAHYLWDLTLSDDSRQPPRLTQVFDGRFLYIRQQSALGTELSYADLGALQSVVQHRDQFVASAAAWYGVGGLSSLLDHLQAMFAFEDAGTKTTGGTPRVSFRVLRGSWREGALRELLREEFNDNWFAGGIQWDRLPKQLPHGVEVWIGSDSYLPNFPYRLIFFQNEKKRLGGWQSVPRVVLTLHQVRVTEALPAETFQIATENLQPTDLTADYVNRSKMYLLYPTIPVPR